MSVDTARAAIRHLTRTDNLHEAMAIARGQIPAPVVEIEEAEVAEDSDPTQATQRSYFVPDEDKANRLMLLVKDKLDGTCKVSTWSQGGAAGYRVDCSGSFSDGDLSELAGTMGGVMPLKRQPGQVESTEGSLVLYTRGGVTLAESYVGRTLKSVRACEGPQGPALALSFE